MYVCVCNRVTEHQLREAVRAGADAFPRIREKLGVASCCGVCEPMIEEMVADARKQRAADGTQSIRSAKASV